MLKKKHHNLSRKIDLIERNHRAWRAFGALRRCMSLQFTRHCIRGLLPDYIECAVVVYSHDNLAGPEIKVVVDYLEQLLI